jgi:hypothetical protein
LSAASFTAFRTLPEAQERSVLRAFSFGSVFFHVKENEQSKIIYYQPFKELVILTAVAISAGCIFFAFYPDLDNISRSPNPGTDLERTGRAVGDTGTAFHAGVEIDDNSFSALHFHDVVGADMGAEAAANAFFRV